MSICERCLHNEVCGAEGIYDDALKFCDDFIGWISKHDMLPQEYADVLVCTDAEEIFIASYLGKMNDGTDCFDDNDGMMWEGDVVAWMPLPEPYKEEMNE